MTGDEFKAALAAAPTYPKARAVVAVFEQHFRRLAPSDRNAARRAWRDRQAELALVGEVKKMKKQPE